jgi:hypothetical protein
MSQQRAGKIGIVSSFFPPVLLCIFVTLVLYGCKQGAHTSDPRLRPIDEMLDAQLPEGTAKSRVFLYLSSQGFPIENTGDAHAIVAIVHHVDTQTLQPATARVTFHFDAADKLKSYELVASQDSSPQP